MINEMQSNKLKPQLLSYKRMTLCACTLIIFLIMFTSPVLIGKMKVSASESLVSDQPHEVEVLLQRQYLDGEMSEEELEETIWSMEDFWSYYDEWELVDQNKDQIVFRKEINDISPLMKMHGYFGIEDDGTLSIYNGKPTENEVIQSFFQINTKQLKSHLHESLLEGIPVSTKDEYLEVLKIYQKYAINGL